MSDQITRDLADLRQVFSLGGLNETAWDMAPITLIQRELRGFTELEALLQPDDDLRLGWIVQTDKVLSYGNGVWRPRRGAPEPQPWKHLLSAELAFSDQRGLRLTLLHGETWSCQEVREGLGDTHCLVSKVTHQAVWGAPGNQLNYRVYWHLEPTLPGTGDPQCYQPIAWRWTAEDTE